MATIDLSEKLLVDAGGWQAMKEARALHQMGRVISAHYEPPILRGLVREGDVEYRAGLKIVSRSNIENICSCRASRQWGTICAHSLALGLKLLAPKVEEPKPERKPEAAEPKGAQFSASAVPQIQLHVILSPNFQAAWEKDQVTVGIEVEQGRERMMLQALDPQGSYTCSPQDLAVIDRVKALNNGALAGMMILNREKALGFLLGLRGHPRVTLGRGERIEIDDLLKRGSTDQKTKTQNAQNDHDKILTPVFTLTLEGSILNLTARLQAFYENSVITVGVSDPARRALGGVDGFRCCRDLLAENQARDELLACGFAGPSASGEFLLKGEAQVLGFFARDLARLQKAWTVSLGSRIEKISSSFERLVPRMDVVRSGESWFEVQVSLDSSGGARFSSGEIQRLLQMGRNFSRTKDGRVVLFNSELLDDLQSVIRDCDPRQQQAGCYRISRAHAGYLDAMAGEGVEVQAPAEWKRWATAQRQLARPEPVVLGSLEGVLRSYQKDGINWLNFLAKNDLGGILADEMGLGKTLQALAFASLPIARADGPVLVVCPSSLVRNWLREAARFVPHLSTVVVEGVDRFSVLEKLQAADLVITSYPLLRRDIDRYRSCCFGTVLLDEAQHIKNPDTQNAQVTAALRATHRFVLTGTPIENSVRDLWSIMNFLLPGYLGDRDDFRERYEVPIAKGDSGVQQRLSKRLKPFLLRRLKKDVAADLPDKIEQISFCDLTERQTEVYGGILDEVRGKLGGATGGKNRMIMLTALLRLRQVCCDLRLLELENLKEGECSAKLELFDELIQEAIDGGHRVLVFSQFVSMLGILKGRLGRAEVPFCYLDGQTKDRLAEVDRFQSDPGVPVFLISLKAGGVGLNLTAADTVIHFDPWWNPAVESQATDRAHRIGQKNVVTSYKLISRGTVEEKILNLQRKKREWAEASLGSEEALVSSLTIDEIESLIW